MKTTVEKFELTDNGYEKIVSQTTDTVVIRDQDGKYELFAIRDSFSGWCLDTEQGKVLEFCRSLPLWQEYRKLRKDFPTFIAKQIACLARMTLEQGTISQDWLDRADELREREAKSIWIDDDCKFTAKLEYDETEGDYSCTGKFVSTWQPGAYDRAEGEEGWDRREYQYILPECDIDKEREANKKLHYGKSEADLMARRVWISQRDNMKRIASNDLQFFGLSVDVQHIVSGVDLGGDCLCGIEIDSTMQYQAMTSYLAEILKDVAIEAKANAKCKLIEIKTKLAIA